MKTIVRQGSVIVMTIFAFLGSRTPLIAQANPSQPLPSSVEVRLTSDVGDPWLEPSSLLGAVGVLGGITGILIQRLWQRRDEERAAQRAERDRLQAHVLDSLKWFGGGTQKRSIGIAVIEGSWATFPYLQPTWISVLANQAVYLLAQAKKLADDALEQENLRRIMALLSEAREALTPVQKKAITDALAENASGGGIGSIGGPKMAAWRDL